MVSQDSENVDQWFEELKLNRRQNEQESPTSSSATDDLFNQLKLNRQSNEQETPNSSSATDDLFNQLKQTHQTQKKHQPEPSYQRKVEEIRVAEQRKQQQQKQLINQAKQWLNNLSPGSDEGFWFEQFALSYPSRLEAAIDYLGFLEGG